MIYVFLGVFVCFFAFSCVYYRLYKKYRHSEENIGLLINRYLELMETHNKTQKEYNLLSDKYKYKLSLIATYQDKLAEIQQKVVDFEKKYNLLLAVYNENKDNLNYAEKLLSCEIEDL